MGPIPSIVLLCHFCVLLFLYMYIKSLFVHFVFFFHLVITLLSLNHINIICIYDIDTDIDDILIGLLTELSSPWLLTWFKVV